jgi:surface carbohydrate biosynthesis protein
MKISGVFNFFKIVFFTKYRFNIPNNKEIVVFDDAGIDQLKPIIKNFNYFVLETRPERLKKIYITKKIIYSMLKNIKIGIFNSYLLSVIDQVNPQVVLTFIDNSYKFSVFAKIRKNKYKFVAVQNGARYEHKIVNLLKKRKIKVELEKFFIPYFFCFGKNEIKDYKKNNQVIGEFNIVGSLRLSNFLINQKSLKKIVSRKTNDILLISDIYCWDNFLEKLNFPIEEGLINLIKFTLKFSKKNKFKIKIAARSMSSNFKREKEFYKKNLNKNEYQYLLKNIFFMSENYKTYKIMQKSKVVIGTMSTMLRENFSLNGKTFACNFTNTNIFDFPIKGLCFSKVMNYENFEKKLFHIYNISLEKYYSKLSYKKNYVCQNNSYETLELINKKLRFMIN